ncbi:hypothetical protein [Tomitella fengzijianii]|uniref:Uncharacterized protein n=1 Tax=Tomitella fengzijianii TaxID=2597660 RepID=A0A516WZI0_9ACTN|nr:hypothetical protein [Tomitella fengzijianii]QDQ96254.1 hypothetical protein FO059_01480 [Tomitella fengzijianii]
MLLDRDLGIGVLQDDDLTTRLVYTPPTWDDHLLEAAPPARRAPIERRRAELARMEQAWFGRPWPPIAAPGPQR